MDEMRYYNSPITLEEAEQYIQSGLITAARAYVANGYYLHRIREDKLFEEAGYQNFEEYVRGKYNKDKGWASKCIKVNQQLSEGGDSPILSKQYLEYSTYQLVELAYMTEEQREEADPDMTVNQLKQIRKTEEAVEPEKSCDVTTSEPEKEQDPEPVEADTTSEELEEKRKEDWLIRCGVLKELCDALCFMNSYGLEKDNYSMIAIQGISSGDYGFGFGDDGTGHSRYNAEYKNFRYYVKEFCEDGNWVFESGEIDQYIWNFNARDWHNANPEEQKQEASPQLESGFYNPDDEKEVDESYSMASFPRASDRHVTMLARLFVQESARRLFGNGEFIGISDEDIIDMLKLFQRRSVGAIIIDNDVEVAVCAEVIEFYRGDEDLGICLFKRFINFARKQIDEYIDQMAKRQRHDDEVDFESKEPETVVEEPETVPGQPESVPDISENVIDGEYVEIPPEPEKQEQPELPILKNNDQRAAFVDAYETWPLWIETKETGERYYRYDLSDGTSMVVKVYHAMLFDYKATGKKYEDRFCEGYGKHEYYFLKEGQFFRDCETNRSDLIEKLKELQKKK